MLSGTNADLLELRTEFTPGTDSQLRLDIHGVAIQYEAKSQTLKIGDTTVAAPLREGKQRMTIYVDRTGLEVFAADGLCYVPWPHNFETPANPISLEAIGDAVDFQRLDAYELKSAWK